MKIRTILTVLVLFLGGALLVAVGVQVRNAADEAEAARRFAAADRVRADFLAAAADLARERGWTYLLLHEPGPPDQQAARQLAELRLRSDRSFDAALSEPATAEFWDLLSGDTEAHLGALRDLLRDARSEADRAAQQPRADRSPDAADRWFTTLAALIGYTADLRFDLLRAVPSADKQLTEHSWLRHYAWIATEQACRGRALLAGAIAEGRPPTDQEFGAIATADAQIGLAWQAVQTILGTGMPPELVEAAANVQRTYFDRLMRLRDRVFGAARASAPYPVSAEQWFANAAEAVEALVAFQAVSVDETAARSAALLAGARQGFLVWTGLGLLGFAAVASCLVVLERRVLAPLRTLATVTGRLAEGDYDVEVPRHRRRDELGAQVRALRTLKANALQARRLRAAKERSERQAAEAIRDREARLRAILASMTEGIVTVHNTGRIETVNDAAARLFGYAPDDMIGRSAAMLVPAFERRRFAPELERYLAAGTSDLLASTQDVTGLRADGSTVALEVTLTETCLAEQRILTAVLRDVAERREVERLKGEFVSTVSHELRTPLTSIRGSLGLLLGPFGGGLAAQARALVEMAHRNAERLIALVNDILDVERIEGGRLEFSFQPLDLVALAREAIEANQSFARERGVTLRLAATPASLRVSGDSGRLLQVMANLLSNAAKFSPRGAEVTVAVAQSDSVAEVAVRDVGPGIPDEFRSRIFQRFAQADSADTRQQGGAGLGLSITKAILERHGGGIGFESRPGDTTFRFTLPALAEAPRAAGPGRRTILVCEDEADTAQLLRLLIEREGFAIDVARTAAEARSRLAERPYAALTLDLSLPDGSGLDLVRELRRTERHRDLPIIVISARALEGKRVINGDAVGVIGWLGKPIDTALLSSTLRQAISRPLGDGLPCILYVEEDPDLVAIVERLLDGKAALVSAASVRAAREQLARHRFDLAILDLSLPDGSGLELLPLLREQPSAPAVMVFAAGEVAGDVACRLEDTLVKSRTTNDELVSRILRLVDGRT